jgi:hypothetical protein
MNKFLESLVRSEGKSCSGKIKFPREDSAERSAAEMMRKKPGEVFEHYKCEFCDGWHIGHRTNFDWIPEAHTSYTLLAIQYQCVCGLLFITNTVVSNRIIEHFPAICKAKEQYVRCPKCKATDKSPETARKLIPLAEVPIDSTESIQSLWDRFPSVLPMGPDLQEENTRLRMAVRNQCADNLCWLTDPEVGKALPELEFLESCRRYHAQITEKYTTLVPGSNMTIAQLEARIAELEDQLKKS